MKRRNWMASLAGAVLIGFTAGACVRNNPNTSSTQDGAIDASAQAQPITNAEDLQQLSASYASLARRVTPAVVNINTEQVVPGRRFRDFFGESFREPDQKAESLGSGVIVDGRGIIITNNHVVENASTITVNLSDRRRFQAKLLGTDPYSDIAVLKIDADKPLPTVQWADSDAAQVGDIVVAIGSPFGLASTVTQGIISAKERRDLGISVIEDFIQTDASINPGNSGGALVDINGRLVGINTAILSRSGGNQGIGLAIPSKLAQRISGQIVASGRVTRGWLGIAAEPMTPDIAKEIGLPEAQGVIVTGVAARGPVADLPWSQQGGNVLLKVNDTPIDSPRQLRSLIASTDPGTKMTLDVWIDGKRQTLDVTVASQPDRVG
ncbi:MAG TPA: trypsin-like peptidase domain-containing protein [Abditibacteriaceae bacterium]|jgi:Do/DeqQ family serine protease